MRLLFEWIKEDRFNVFKNCGINFTGDYFIEYDEEHCTLKLKRNEKTLPENFYSVDKDGRAVSQVTCIVGKNGTGKTNLLKHIYNTDLVFNKKYKEKYIYFNTVQVFEFDNKLKIYHNLEKEINVVTEEQYELYVMNSVRNDIDEIVNYGDYANISKFYLSNDYWVSINNNFIENGRQAKLAITPYDIHIAQSTFFDKICVLQTGLTVCNDEFYRFNQYLKKNANQSYLQNIFYLFLYYNTIKTDASSDLLNLLNKFSVQFHAINEMDQFIDCFGLLQIHKNGFKWKKIFYNSTGDNPIGDIIKATGDTNFSRFSIDCLKICVIYSFLIEKQLLKRFKLYNTLIVELLFNLYQIENIFELENYDVEYLIGKFKSYIESINKDSVERSLKQKELEYFNQANKSVSALERLLGENSSDINNFRLNYLGNKQFVVNFLDYIIKELEDDRSFILKYIWVKSGFSSGEFGYLNFFSCLSAIPYWKYFSNNAIKGISSYVLLMIDEPDSFCHPEWQRCLLKKIISTCESLYKDKKIHIIFSTHSPLFLSDIPGQNVIKLTQSNTQVTLSGNGIKTFAANIFDLYNDDFFLDKFIGDFAYNKINNAIKVIGNVYKGNKYDDQEFENAKLICSLVGEPVLRNKLLQMVSVIEARNK